ncbi:MAG: nucleoside monophosphate kinase [Patescibacteria group bacterium]
MILLMGIAGAGKGTQSKLLSDKDGFNIVSTGDLLRVYGSDNQHRRMHKGEILGDQEVTDLLERALSEIPDQNNVILDGYPRRISQAQWLLDQQKEGRFQISCVIHLVASHEAVRARLLERSRPDDHDDGIEQRFSEYERDTVPILDYLAGAGVKVNEVNAEQPVESVHAEIVHLLKEV